MSVENVRRTGAQILVDQLRLHGVDLAFCVPGESYLSVLDALYDHRGTLRLIVCRHEAAAANMAEAAGKLTGQPGICFVTRGPGATHASIGLHTAFQDSTPLILFVGQVARGHEEREAFQELDYRRFFNPQIAKWSAQINDPRRIPEFVSRAFHIATSGRPGPVVLALPEDMLDEECEVSDPLPYQPVQAAPEPAAMAALGARLVRAVRPLVLLGGGGWTDGARRDIAQFAEHFQLPVAVSFRCQDRFDNRHPLYVGHVGVGIDPALAQHVRDADLILAVGPRLGEATTRGYTLLASPRPRQALIHVHASAEELGRVYQCELLINSGMANFAAAARTLAPPAGLAWRAWTDALRTDYLSTLAPTPTNAKLDLARIMVMLNERLPRDAILCNGAGNYATWVHRFYQYPAACAQLAPTSGAMGYGVPAAIAAKLIHPERMVLAFGGDGCFLMAAQELATAVRYGLQIVFLVINNNSYGTIRMHQETHFPERVSGTDLVNPDFAALARAFGLFGERVTRTEEFWPAFERARDAGGPALIELITEVENITPRTTLAALRQRAGISN
ncbi:MAG: thiamine pyrophosphate-binding protein [Verrucomicrobia bacterium]|nr:thiamine pyrophosphate-binding protein [Verrucomicrobiota bacterium]